MQTFYTSDRREWSEYLAAHFRTDSEIWFVFPTKAAGEPALSYNDAVEEALCFGWIDSTNSRPDEFHCARRVTSPPSSPERRKRADVISTNGGKI